MWRSTSLALLFGVALWSFGELTALPIDGVLRASLAVALGTVTAAIAYGQASFLPVSLGALSPLLFAVVARHSLALATSVMCFIWIAPRLVLAETRRRLVLTAALSLGAATVAGFMFAGYIDAPWSAHVAACVFAGSCLSLVSLIGLESPITFALRSAAAATDPPARDALERAARVHQLSLGKSSSKQWRALICLADQRAALARTRDPAEETRKDLDERIVALTEELAPPSEAPKSEAAQATSETMPETTPEATS